MFNGNFRHPLDNLIRDDRLFIMEAIIPFVDDNMKAPLAMYIKFMELKAILEALRDPGYVNSCGLHKDINNQDDIFSSLASCGLMGGKEQLENMKKAMNVMNMMNRMQQDGDSGSGVADSVGADSDGAYHNDDYYETDQLYQHYNTGSHSKNHQEKDLFGSIKDLFDEYDRNH